MVQIRDALNMALDDALDLIEISPNAEPPVCKIMDLGKYKYELHYTSRSNCCNQQTT